MGKGEDAGGRVGKAGVYRVVVVFGVERVGYC